MYRCIFLTKASKFIYIPRVYVWPLSVQTLYDLYIWFVFYNCSLVCCCKFRKASFVVVLVIYFWKFSSSDSFAQGYGMWYMCNKHTYVYDVRSLNHCFVQGKIILWIRHCCCAVWWSVYPAVYQYTHTCLWRTNTSPIKQPSADI